MDGCTHVHMYLCMCVFLYMTLGKAPSQQGIYPSKARIEGKQHDVALKFEGLLSMQSLAAVPQARFSASPPRLQLLPNLAETLSAGSFGGYISLQQPSSPTRRQQVGPPLLMASSLPLH